MYSTKRDIISVYQNLELLLINASLYPKVMISTNLILPYTSKFSDMNFHWALKEKKFIEKKLYQYFFQFVIIPHLESSVAIYSSVWTSRENPIHLGWLLSEWVGINLQSISIQCFLCALQNSLWHPHPQQLLKSSLTSSFHGYRITLTCMGSSPLSKPM